MDKVKKALKVLRSGTTNKFIISDMLNVLEKEFMHIRNSLDASSNHNEELMEELSSLKRGEE